MTNNGTDWLSLMLALESIEEGFDEYRMPLTGRLAERRFELCPEKDDRKILIHFKNGSHLNWGWDGEPLKEEHYEAMEIRPNIFFVDWVYHTAPKKSMSIVIDLSAQEATLLCS